MDAAVFLDRDDTLIECRSLPAPAPPALPGDLVDPALVRLLPGVAEALADLRQAGFRLVVVSNQGVVARGGATVDVVEAINERMRTVLRAAGGPGLDGVYFCPFHPRGNVPEFTREHPWRKPGAGMILAAAAELGLDLSRSWLIGDADRDVEAGLAAGIAPARCLRIGESCALPDMAAAADVILTATSRPVVVSGAPVVELTLTALEAEWLARARTASTVLATAHAMAERAGIALAGAAVRGGTLRLALAADRLTGLGFLAELRRTTNRWHKARTGAALWPGDGEELDG